MEIKNASVDAQVIYQKIIMLSVGERVSYAKLTEIIGRNVQLAARGVLDTARRMALRENRMVFGVERGKGIVRLDDVGIVVAGCAGLSRIRRLTKKSAKVLACVSNFDAMPNEEKIKHNAALSIFGALSQATKPTTVKRVQEATNAQQSAIPLAKTLGMFVGS